MKTLISLLPACLLALSAPGWAQLWDARRDFSTNSNPNGQWSYGWSTGLTNPVVLFPRFHVPEVNNGQQEMWDDPANSNAFTPSVSRNAGDDYDDGNATFKAGALLLHGCGTSGGDYAHVMWTAPVAGRYQVTGWFYAQQNGLWADVQVLLNGNPIFSDLILRNGQLRLFGWNLRLAAADTLTFSVGPYNRLDLHPGNVGLEAIIKAVPLYRPESSIRVSEVEICWQSETNALYRVEYRLEVTGSEWLPLYTNLVGTGERICVADRLAPEQPQRFYRVISPKP